MVRLSAELSFLQKVQRILLPLKEVSTRLEPLHRMHDQVKIVELLAGRLEVSRKASRGRIQNGRELCQSNRRRPVERSGRAAAQDYLLDYVLRLFFDRQRPQRYRLVRWCGRNKGLLPVAPLSHLFFRFQRRRLV